MDLNLKNKEVFIFDWDRTIIDSMDIKIKNFTETLYKLIDLKINYCDFADSIKSLYERYSGLPRETLFKNILREANIGTDIIQYSDFDRNFSILNKTNLLKAKIFEDARSFIKLLIKNKKIIFISSSMPQEELVFFTSKKLNMSLRKNIRGILGTESNFSKGNNHFEFIERDTGYKREKFLFIGDDVYDYRLSRDAEVDFVLINRKLKKFLIPDIFEISSFSELEGFINGKV
ncbi:MAG: HAD family hydrolase [Actinobacteria bacterium]|nr:HAD family hydrolase [Actinomycetota bacterium]MBM3711915.1 HAD family hydrolase [Actinomycetota bacterium]